MSIGVSGVMRRAILAVAHHLPFAALFLRDLDHRAAMRRHLDLDLLLGVLTALPSACLRTLVRPGNIRSGLVYSWLTTRSRASACPSIGMIAEIVVVVAELLGLGVRPSGCVGSKAGASANDRIAPAQTSMSASYPSAT